MAGFGAMATARPKPSIAIQRSGLASAASHSSVALQSERVSIWAKAELHGCVTSFGRSMRSMTSEATTARQEAGGLVEPPTKAGTGHFAAGAVVATVAGCTNSGAKGEPSGR